MVASQDSGDDLAERDPAAAAAAEVYAAVCVHSSRRFDEFKPQELANTIWAVATTGFGPRPQFWDAAVEAMIAKLEGSAELRTSRTNPPAATAQPQNVANFVWAVAKVLPGGGPSPDARRRLFATVAAVSIEHIDQFNPQELGNVVWAFATAREPAETLLDAVADVAGRKLPRFIPQNLANVAWAYATAGRGRTPRDVGFFEAIAAESRRRLADFKPQELTNLAWAFATAGLPAPDLFEALAAEASRRLDAFSDQGIANLAWAFSTSGAALDHLRFMDDLAELAARRVPRLLPQGLANLAWSYANVELRADALFDAIARELVAADAGVSRRAAALKPQEFANIAWAFAKSNYDARPAVYAALAAGMLALAARHGDDLAAAGLTHQELANLAWAYACADRVDPALHALLWRAVVARASATYAARHTDLDAAAASPNDDDDDAVTRAFGFNLEERRQLQQVVLHARYEATGAAAIVSDIARSPPAFLAVLRDSLATLDSKTSRSQADVSAAVRDLGISVVEELVIPDGLSIDVALEPLSHRVGLEFDGPYHYFRNRPDLETGRTAFKKRLLAACGWTVLHVPYFDWATLDRTPAARMAYLKKALAHLLRDKRARRARRATAAAAAPRRRRLPTPGAGLMLADLRPDLDTERPPDDPPATDPPPSLPDHLRSLKVADLRNLCLDRGLDKTVRRTEGDARSVLVSRLLDYAARHPDDPLAADDDTPAS
mmetsp:Transcript_20318/g.63830  ORF Transcript_20318/g.63830 Transcript_20318/m.63830 type:complete len:724 (-) Transcript_20318:284-2455(-)